MSRNLSDLHPEVADQAKALLSKAEALGFTLLVTQTYRTMEDQAAIYAIGRTIPPFGAIHIITSAPPGWSWHNFRRAFDVCFVRHGKAWYPAGDGPEFQAIGDLAESLGLEWGGRWKHPDWDHFENRGGLTLAQARQAQGPGQDLPR